MNIWHIYIYFVRLHLSCINCQGISEHHSINVVIQLGIEPGTLRFQDNHEEHYATEATLFIVCPISYVTLWAWFKCYPTTSQLVNQAICILLFVNCTLYLNTIIIIIIVVVGALMADCRIPARWWPQAFRCNENFLYSFTIYAYIFFMYTYVDL